MVGTGPYEAIVVGTSAGGLNALTAILSALPAGFGLPVIVVQHRSKDQRDLLEDVLQHKCLLSIRQADEKEPIRPGVVYIAPPDYHLLIESDKTLSLSADEPVLFSRPSIDVLFESAAVVFKTKLVGILLTGASSDGTRGMLAIKKAGGCTIAQDPAEALFAVMPRSAIEAGAVNKIMSLKKIHKYLMKLNNNDGKG